MINLDDESYLTIKKLAKATGLPIGSYAKMLVKVGMPVINSIIENVDKTNRQWDQALTENGKLIALTRKAAENRNQKSKVRAEEIQLEIPTD
jgi:hypothetical protein